MRLEPKWRIGAVLGSIALSGSLTAATAGSWRASGNELTFTVEGKAVKQFEFLEKTGWPHFNRVKGGVCARGQFAWLDSRKSTPSSAEYLFEFFGPDGSVLWSKTTVVGETISPDCAVIVLMEADPISLSKNEHGNSPYKPTVYDREGRIVLDLTECRTFSETAQLRGRYGVITCSPGEPSGFHLLFDAHRKKTKKLPLSTGVEIQEDGSYALFTEKQAFDPVTKKYGDFVRQQVGAGKF